MDSSPYGPHLWEHAFPPTEPPLAGTVAGDLFELLEFAARDHGDRPHITFEGRSLAYRETCTLARVLAAALVERGIGAGDRVGLCLPNTPAYVILCFALWRIGAIGVGMNPLYSEAHLTHQAVDAGLALLFGVEDGAAADKIAGVAEAIGRPLFTCAASGADLDEPRAVGGDQTLATLLRSKPLDDGFPRPDPASVAMLQYTGGTTGAPKGAMLSQRALAAATRRALSCMPYLERGREAWHAAAPLSHVSGLISYICVATAAAGEMLLAARFHPAELIDLLRLGRPTVLTAIPTMLTALLSAPDLETARWDRVKHVITGGAPTPIELARRFHAVSGLWVQQSYGMTETCGVAACMPPGGAADHADATGAPLPGIQVEIRSLDDPDTPAPLGESGEICVGGDILMDGYWPARTGRAHLTADGLMRTGDVGIIEGDGFLRVVDRLKDVVVCSGYKVYPRVIDEAVLEHPAIQEAISLGVPDSYRGETILVAAVTRPDHELTLEQLQAFLKGRLSAIEMPKQLVVLDELPKSENGKLSRKLVREALIGA